MDKIVEAVSPILFKEDGANVFAVLDGASVPDLLDKLYGAQRPQFECLYTGEIKPDLAEVAPYLVRLEPKSEFTEWVIKEGWGKHWGVFVVAPVDFLAMRHHLRRFLMVHGSDGKAFYFRYYDPRVLRTYLPSCNSGELTEFFGPVKTWVLEGEDPGALLRFDLADGKLVPHKDELKTA
ncbi:MAG: DUF4123 domain-containing protein [Bryobacteraceae bacterium]|jgi:hypothetical protein